MSELGDVFELVVAGPLRASSFSAECHRQLRRNGERRYRIWWAGDGRVREEGHDERGRLVSLYVESASCWWRWQKDRGAVTNALGDPKERANSELAWMLLSHGRIAVDPQTQVDRHEVTAGRDAIVLHLPEREISVDAEYGVTLRSVYQGHPIFEVDDIAFDVVMPPDRFEFSPPAGVRLRAASSDRPAPQPVEQVAPSVDFQVFAPRPIVLSWPVDAQSWPARRGRPDVVTVRLRAAPLWIHQSANHDPESFASRFGAPEEWSRTVRDGVELEVRDHPAVVRLIKEGTHIEVYGEAANVEELITIALSLRTVVTTDSKPGP